MPQKKPFITLAQAKEIAVDIPTPFHLYDEKGIRENARKVNARVQLEQGLQGVFRRQGHAEPLPAEDPAGGGLRR